jgi:hypothetical protein
MAIVVARDEGTDNGDERPAVVRALARCTHGQGSRIEDPEKEAAGDGEPRPRVGLDVVAGWHGLSRNRPRGPSLRRWARRHIGVPGELFGPCWAGQDQRQQGKHSRWCSAIHPCSNAHGPRLSSFRAAVGAGHIAGSRNALSITVAPEARRQRRACCRLETGTSALVARDQNAAPAPKPARKGRCGWRRQRDATGDRGRCKGVGRRSLGPSLVARRIGSSATRNPGACGSDRRRSPADQGNTTENSCLRRPIELFGASFPLNG